jgi:hypothetical protein
MANKGDGSCRNHTKAVVGSSPATSLHNPALLEGDFAARSALTALKAVGE